MFIFSSCHVQTEMRRRGAALPCIAATLHVASWLSWVFIFRDRALFYFLLLINKLHIKLLKRDFSLRPLLSLDASDAEAMESSISTVLTFIKGTVVLFLQVK